MSALRKAPRALSANAAIKPHTALSRCRLAYGWEIGHSNSVMGCHLPLCFLHVLAMLSS
jgi:hypothetical protein